MPEEPQDILTISLLKLEEELTTFGKFQNALVNAREDLKKAEQEWATLTKEQQQSALTLVNATKTAIETTNLVVAQTKSLTETLIPLARAIETVNFPLRLDKIDMAVATQASTLSSFQTKTERGLNETQDELKRHGTEILNVNSNIEESKKRDWLIIGLLILNTISVAAMAISSFIHH
jgi:hypothetical protein